MTTALIGRDHPAGLLRAEIGRAVDSHGGLVLVTGEAGIGKTTLVTQAAEEARRQGALVLGGSCWDSDSTPGYWPWVQVIRALRRAATPEEWAAAAEASAGGLPILLGESRGTEEVEAFRLYDAVTSALVAVSQHRPVLVVLDDLHWADTASLRLLEFAAQHTWFERLLLVGTYRDAEVEAVDHPLRPLLASLTAKATSVTLTGLGVAEVAALMTRTAGREPGPELAAEVHRRTGGNPFFVEQTARLWLSGGAITATAPGVRDALDRRLSLLPAPVVELLTAAAVLGREFHPEVLAAVTGAPPARVDRSPAWAPRLRFLLTGGGPCDPRRGVAKATWCYAPPVPARCGSGPCSASYASASRRGAVSSHASVTSSNSSSGSIFVRCTTTQPNRPEVNWGSNTSGRSATRAICSCRVALSPTVWVFSHR